MVPGTLAGIRVLDLTRVLAGPFATMLLADAGADVVKIEPPGGDDTRRWGPPWAGGESAYYLSVNRNKRGLCLDLAHPAGRDILLRLVDGADVVVENFKVGTMERWGLGYEATLRPRHPRLVYAGITGYGRTGPDAHLPGYDVIVEARGGLMSITGEPGGAPVKVGVAIVDVVTGCLAAYGISAALVRRAASGAGGRVDLALLDSCLAALANQAGNYLIGGVVPGRLGNAHPSIVPYQTFPTAAGTLMVGAGNDPQFARFCAVVGLPGLPDDPRFRTNPDRVRHRDELSALLTAALRGRTAAEWSALCGAAGVPAGPVRDLAAAFADPQVAARGLVSAIDHPTAGAVRTVTSPVRFDDTPPRPYRHPPLLGEHTEEVLREAGFTAEQIAGWSAAGVVS